MAFCKSTPEGIVVTAKAKPRSSRSQIVETGADELAVYLHSPPVDGKANAEIIELFSKRCSIPKRSVVILAGETGKLKRILLKGLESWPANTNSL